jgi:3-vinyl bacteriochlorophyllide hydratase
LALKRWPAAEGQAVTATTAHRPSPGLLYTDEQRRRRDATAWTLVQGILAPVQFLVCLVSAGLVVRFLLTGDGYTAATVSILIKTALLLTIMVTGAIWEKVVFGQYLFAPPFFWEDVVSGGVIALHLAYVGALMTGALAPRALMGLALVSYAAYAVNAAQFVWKLRQARLQQALASMPASSLAPGGAT